MTRPVGRTPLFGKTPKVMISVGLHPRTAGAVAKLALKRGITRTAAARLILNRGTKVMGLRP